MSTISEEIDRTARSFTGQLVQPTHPGYDGWRRVHNGLIDKHPAAIARCHGVADVVDAVKLARTLELNVAVRGGGHNVAGHATLDHGLLIDLSPMKGIHVDVPTRTARAQGGVLWKELNLATVYFNHVARLAKVTGTDAAVVLGRAVAHELGHLLMRTPAHPRCGLMRPSWTEGELRRNRAADRVFTAGDVVAMHRSWPRY